MEKLIKNKSEGFAETQSSKGLQAINE